MNIPAVALIYLARGVDGGFGSASDFFASYRRHPTGLAHRLYVIVKGWPDAAARRDLTALVKAAGGEIVDLPDDGFDLMAYYRLASGLREGQVCFLNTFSLIESNYWLRRLGDALDLPGVGLAGCTASYGTLRPSLRNILVSTFETAKSKPLKTTLGHMVAYTRDYWHQRQAGEQFPDFPNPHVRTNGFMLARKTFLDFWKDKSVPQTKLAVCALKSGTAGLTRFIEARGQRAVVVGADGNVYEKADWPRSRTFRVPAQANNMVSDNATRHYLTNGREYRRKKEFAAWGRCFTA